ncbi:hypothetical protein BDV93DRAFT_547007 [Ceratobasidium sp. AG-I]|nr:hypothetical protein BDV93DRAFT_547007 [Ceratobasidium sp. AG-I]
MILKKVTAWITDADGFELPEHQTKEIDENTIECWIPSTEGTNFRIRWKSEKGVQSKLDLRCTPYLDGVSVSGRSLKAKSIKRGEYREMIGRSTGESSIQLYCFGKRQLTDCEDDAPLTEAYEDLNTIRLKLRWGTGIRTAKSTCNEPLKPKPIHERMAKKGHSGSAELSAPIDRPRRARYNVDFTPEPDLEPLVFIFRYAPEDWLQAREIIPPSQLSKNSSSPEPKTFKKRARSSTPDIIDIDDLETDDDEVILVKHMAPVVTPPNKRRRKAKDEQDIKPKLEL